MADKLMYITNNDTQNYPFCRLQLKGLDSKLFKPFKIQLKSPKLLSQSIRKNYYKTLGTNVINSSMSPPSLMLLLECCIRFT